MHCRRKGEEWTGGQIENEGRMLQMADEVMVIIWKRLSDSGRNWRHVYKSLILVQYLVINGSERVSRLFG